MRESFRQQLRESGYLHQLLQPDPGLSVEVRLRGKPAIASRVLWDGGGVAGWTRTGVGRLEQHGQALRLTAPARLEPTAPMEHYHGFSTLTASLALAGEDWHGFNRLVCRIRAACHGFHHPFLTIHLRNEGVQPIPDEYRREGFHVVNLANHRDNDCIWEFPDLPRDRITSLSFTVDSHGKERFGADDLVFDISDIRLERVADPDVSLGWCSGPHTLCYSTSGYWCNGRKTAVAPVTEGRFEVRAEGTDEVVFAGDIQPLVNEKGRFGQLDFSAVVTPGQYRLQAAGMTTEAFAIGTTVMEEAAWKALNFVYAERCGYPVAGGHSSCHGDITATHNGRTLAFCGGWHDAGDVSQQTVQSAEMVQALVELATAVRADRRLYRRLVEEARWGLDFVLRTRLGDGYRAFSAGMSRWSNGLIGDFDDEAARVHNRSIDNFLCAGVQACAGQELASDDPDLGWVAVRAAREDYDWARARFGQVGAETRIVMEHTHNASLSQYWAAASWAASQLYRATGETYFAGEAAHWLEPVLRCQDRGQAGLPFQGFFYRDETQRAIVHFNHQSREHLILQALQAAATTQPDHARCGAWTTAMAHYGAYLKAIFAHAAPYGMLPAGVHAYDEADDAETFALLHVYTTHAAEREHYRAQLRAGVPVGPAHCVRQFPVWFSFRGNTAVLLAAGKAAAIVGRHCGDQDLLDMARDQLYWVAGKNPFGQSLMYGEGRNYAQQYAALCGETVGEMPVGVQTRGDEDQPYWPMANYATYKEIWMTTAAHWFRLLADVYEG